MKVVPSTEALDRMTQAVDTSVQTLADFTQRPRPHRALRIAAGISVVVILALVAFGAVMIATMVDWLFVAAGAVLLALVPVSLGGFAGRSRVVHAIVVTPFAVVVPVVALLGFDVLWSWARIPRPAPAVGLLIAAIVVAAVAYAYLRWLGKPAPRHVWPWALWGLVSSLVLVAMTAEELPDPELVLAAAFVGGAIWIYLHRSAGPDIEHALAWSLLLSGVAVVLAPLLAEAIQGKRTSVALLIAAAVIALVLGVDWLWPRRGSVRRRQALHVVGLALILGVVVPFLALGVVALAGSAASVPEGVSLPPAAPAGALPEAALSHRPILLFDSGERFRTPLDVNAMFATGDVELCPEGKGLLVDCREVKSASDLRNGFGNLRFDAQSLEDDVHTTTIYAQAVPDRLHPGWTDIDYWWYMPDNPANTAQGAMCGAGFVIPEITCFDHQSDWEGATVVVDEHQMPVAVHYASHKHVIEVPWTALQTAYAGRLLRPYVAGRDVANHPLVFIARGTHAAYPLPCRSSICGAGVLKDNRHDGHFAWPEETCAGKQCVSPFPTAQGGGNASWNAFDGDWGSAVCIAKDLYCARSRAPKAPGTQPRFKKPWCYDFAVGTDLAHPRDVKPPGC